jgi:hypothetical protein
MRSPVRVAVLCLALTSLSGCQVMERIGTAFSPPSSQPEVVATRTHGDSITTDTPPTVAGEQTARVSPVDDNPEQFLGLDGPKVDQTLGEPDLVRRDGPAEVRQFRGDDCVLDLFLYPETGGLAVKHVELRGPSLDNVGRRACLAEMIRTRAVAG